MAGGVQPAVLALNPWGSSPASAVYGMELMLKGGQMGPEDLFERLLQAP